MSDVKPDTSLSGQLLDAANELRAVDLPSLSDAVFEAERRLARAEFARRVLASKYGAGGIMCGVCAPGNGAESAVMCMVEIAIDALTFPPFPEEPTDES